MVGADVLAGLVVGRLIVEISRPSVVLHRLFKIFLDQLFLLLDTFQRSKDRKSQQRQHQHRHQRRGKQPYQLPFAADERCDKQRSDHDGCVHHRHQSFDTVAQRSEQQIQPAHVVDLFKHTDQVLHPGLLHLLIIQLKRLLGKRLRIQQKQFLGSFFHPIQQSDQHRTDKI